MDENISTPWNERMHQRKEKFQQIPNMNNWLAIRSFFDLLVGIFVTFCSYFEPTITGDGNLLKWYWFS